MNDGRTFTEFHQGESEEDVIKVCPKVINMNKSQADTYCWILMLLDDGSLIHGCEVDDRN